MGYGVLSKNEIKSNASVQEGVDSLLIIPICLTVTVYCKVRRANFPSFPSNPDSSCCFQTVSWSEVQTKKKRAIVFVYDVQKSKKSQVRNDTMTFPAIWCHKKVTMEIYF